MQNLSLMLSQKEAKLVSKMFHSLSSDELSDFTMEFARESSPVRVFLTQGTMLMIERSDYGGVFAHESYMNTQEFQKAYR